jgi:nucleoside-diphosphate-sugar epimerase
MKILITGALGHIGSKLIHSFKPALFGEVHLIDNLSTQRYSSLFNLPSGIHFRFYDEDICSAKLDNYFQGIDVVIHLAAVTDAASSFDKPEQFEMVNFKGTEKVALACLRNGCKLLFPSTTSVYGTQLDVVDENCTDIELKPQSPYAESKLKAEKILQQLGSKSDLKYVIYRFGTIFGTSIGMRFHTAVNKFVWQARLAMPITIWKTAMNQKRPYLHLDDAVNSILFAIEKNLFINEIYNIVTVNATVKEIIQIIKTEINNIKIEYVDSKIMNQLTYNVLSDKIKKAGFIFCGGLENGILETIKIFNGIRNY